MFAVFVGSKQSVKVCTLGISYQARCGHGEFKHSEISNILATHRFLPTGSNLHVIVILCEGPLLNYVHTYLCTYIRTVEPR